MTSDLELSIIPGPVWPNACKHMPEAYVASFECLRSSKLPVEQFDLYVFDNLRGQEVCMRYGAEPDKYCSPGPLHCVFGLAEHDERYLKATRILIDRGMLRWKKKKDKS